MHKLRKAAVVAALLGSVGFFGAGTASAYAGHPQAVSCDEGCGSYGERSGGGYGEKSDDHSAKSGGYGEKHGGYGKKGGHGESGGDKIEIRQGTSCRSEDTNVDILGEVGIANGLGGNLGGGEGAAGAQSTTMGSSMGCNNSVGK
ncbi:hypothetical protein [Streptomyces sp. NPDC053427]|uniref:hypothetical protein n=1 Tax=Streptomyces sp. NPDC053427 TaxID=3365701 RepID=UPI0037D20BE8